ncbi:hypothetical protein LENED_012076 [Lentinula edodes]|uniref:Uncharacterized protein n=1 Tax=Lentinula edodes TaxID=5353 RepID=A0A1Q3ERN7_LENED|nr:hypothetical protein LENED_012076 [Lentinula edodes]
MIMTLVKKSVVTICLGLALEFGCISALPQQASVSLFEFLPSGESNNVVQGTEWAQPIGTASDGSETTFIVENIQSTSGLVSSNGAIVLTTVTETAIETIVVSASGWAESNFPTTTAADSSQLGGGLDCHFTASASGECVEEEVLDDGSTSTRTLSGSVTAEILAISTGTLPSGVGVSAITYGSQQSTITVVSTTSSNVQSTITFLSPSSSSTSASTLGSPSASASSNTSSSVHKGLGTGILAVIVGGIMLGASAALF